MKKITDALGMPVVIGKMYGYSRSSNGTTYVRIGRLKKINDKSVTIEVLQSSSALYNNELKKFKSESSTISVKSIGIFPIFNDIYNMKRNNKLYNFDEFLNEEFLDVSIGNIVVGSVDSGDDKTIKKISDISKGSKYKASIVNELKELNFPDSQANIIYNKLLSSSNIEGVLDYIKNKRVKLNSLLGKVTNASDINKLIGIKGEDSDDLFSYKWASSPPMGSGEAWLSLMIDGGRRPKGEKGDVIINNAEVEVKGDGARIIGQKGYGDGKQMRKSLERAVINISDKLNLNPPTDIIIVYYKLHSFWSTCGIC